MNINVPVIYKSVFGSSTKKDIISDKAPMQKPNKLCLVRKC